MKHHIKIAIILFWSFSNAKGQVELEKRFEFENDQVDNFSIHPINNTSNALGIFTPSDAEIMERNFVLYDKDLNEIKKASISSEFKYTRSQHIISDEYYYHILHHHKTGKALLFQVELSSLSLKTHEFNLPPKMYIDDLNENGQVLYFDLKLKRETAIGVYKIGTPKVEIISPNAQTGLKGYIYKIQKVDGADQEIMFFFENKSKNKHQLHIFRFDINGKQLKRWVYKDLDKKIVSFSAYKVSSNKYLALGEYSQKSISSSEGLFSAIIDSDGKISFKEYHNFLEMPNFLEYMSDKREKKIEQKIKKKESQGKELTYQFNVAKHKIQYDGTNYMYAGEFYYATYRTEWYTTYVNGNPVQRTRRVFDGYQYTHALISVFDENGKFQWSNIFSMWQAYKPFYVKHFLTTSFEAGKVNTMFTNGRAIINKSFENGKVIKDSNYDLITTGDVNDKIKYNVGTDVTHWYGEHFINDGFQKIKNKENESGNKKRKVYYVNLYKIVDN